MRILANEAAGWTLCKKEMEGVVGEGIHRAGEDFSEDDDRSWELGRRMESARGGNH